MGDTPHHESFEAYWVRFVRAHAHSSTRLAHFFGTGLAPTAGLDGIGRRRPARALVGLLTGLSINALSHLVLQGERPSTLGRPLWSARAHLRLFFETLTGTMGTHVEQVMSTPTRTRGKRSNGASRNHETTGAQTNSWTATQAGES